MWARAADYNGLSTTMYDEFVACAACFLNEGVRRTAAALGMRLQTAAGSPWVFPARTMSGHIEPSSLKRQHAKALRVSSVAPFDLYTLRHTCLTRWAPFMDPWTLAYLAGHRDMNITKRYVHPQEHTIREAMEKARSAQGRHKQSTVSERLHPATSAGVGTIN